MVEKTLGAERYGHSSTVRWATHVAMDEIRTVGQLLIRFADLALHNVRRDPTDPRTTLPTTSTMYAHYRGWATRWRGYFREVVEAVIARQEALSQQQRDDLQAREDQQRHLAEIAAREHLRDGDALRRKRAAKDTYHTPQSSVH